MNLGLISGPAAEKLRSIQRDEHLFFFFTKVWIQPSYRPSSLIWEPLQQTWSRVPSSIIHGISCWADGVVPSWRASGKHVCRFEMRWRPSGFEWRPLCAHLWATRWQPAGFGAMALSRPVIAPPCGSASVSPLSSIRRAETGTTKRGERFTVERSPVKLNVSTNVPSRILCFRSTFIKCNEET